MVAAPAASAPADRPAPALSHRTRAWPFRAGLLLVFGLTVLHGAIYAFTTPLLTGPDEDSHYEYARLLYETGRVPQVSDISQEVRNEMAIAMARTDGSHFWPSRAPLAIGYRVAFATAQDKVGQIGRQPPGYYALSAVAYGLTRDAGLPVQIFSMRLLSVLMGAGVVVLAALAARQLFPQDPWIAIGASAFVLWLPQFTYVTASINNDALVILATSLAVLAVVRICRQGWTWGNLALLGGGAALTIAAKSTGLAAVAPLLLGALPGGWLARRRTGSRGARLSQRWLLAGSGALLVGLTLLALSGRPLLESGLGRLFTWLQLSPDTLAKTGQGVGSEAWLWTPARWLSIGESLFQSFWAAMWFEWSWAPARWLPDNGASGGSYSGLDTHFYDALLLLSALALGGLGRWLWRLRRARRAATGPEIALLVLAGAVLVTTGLLIIPFLTPALSFSVPQARYLYPLIIPIALLFVWGIRQWVPKRWERGALVGLLGAYALFDAVVFLAFCMPYHYA